MNLSCTKSEKTNKKKNYEVNCPFCLLLSQLRRSMPALQLTWLWWKTTHMSSNYGERSRWRWESILPYTMCWSIMFKMWRFVCYRKHLLMQRWSHPFWAPIVWSTPKGIFTQDILRFISGERKNEHLLVDRPQKLQCPEWQSGVPLEPEPLQKEKDPYRE